MLSASAAALATAVADALRSAGVTVVPVQVQRFAAALAVVDCQQRSELYWAARITLVNLAADLATFEVVFTALLEGPPDRTVERLGEIDSAVELRDVSDQTLAESGWAGDGHPLPPPPVHRGVPESDGELAPGSEGAEGADGAGGADGAAAGQRGLASDRGPDGQAVRNGDAELDAPPAAMSVEERLGARDFATLTDDELAELRALVARIALRTPLRRTRRTRARAHGRVVDIRGTLRHAGRAGGEPVRLARRERRQRARRLVLVCDVSGSMEPYTRVFLGLLRGAVSAVDAEAFVFATRLTRVTDELRVTDPDAALARAAERATDMAGGTRMGECLREFLDRYGRRGMARGAVLVILSDGWTSDAEVVGEQLARLARVCHRIVWVNPRKAAPEFQPLVGGLAAGLPYCDAFVSGHTLRSLDEVARAVGGESPAGLDGWSHRLDRSAGHVSGRRPSYPA